MTRAWQWDLLTALLGLLLVIFGAFGAWVPHKTAALTVTGLELVEFAKFFPEVQAGDIPIVRALFALPALMGAITLALLTQWNARRVGWRILLSGLALAVTLTAMPPYRFLQAPEYRLQLVLTLASILLILFAPLTRALPSRIQGGFVALLALAGTVAPLWQFYQLHPLVAELYDTPVAPGWGLLAFPIGSVLLFVSGLLNAAHHKRTLRF